MLVDDVSSSAIPEVRSAPGDGAGSTYVPFVHKRYRRKHKSVNWPLRGRRGFGVIKVCNDAKSPQQDLNALDTGGTRGKCRHAKKTTPS